MVRWRTQALVVAAAAVALSFAIGVIPTAGAAPRVLAWAALGDSYTAGPLIPTQIPDPPGCLRSDHNYPHLAAAALGFTLRDASCSGATVADLTATQATSQGANPPQLSVVANSDRVFTLGIGGNDIGFSEIVDNCAALTPFGPTSVGLTCKSFYDAGGKDAIAARINALRPAVVAALRRIHALAPRAHVYVVGYPAILPPTGSGCWPQLPFTHADVPYLRAEQVQLNAMLAGAAEEGRAGYVDTYTPSEPHNACTAESTRWIEPVIPASPAYPVHPNAAGEAGLARAVELAMAAHRS